MGMVEGPRVDTVRRYAALLGLVLVIFASTLAAVHFHQQDSDTPSKAHCLICVETHSPTALASSAEPVRHLSARQETVRTLELSYPSELVSPELFIRPPPAA